MGFWLGKAAFVTWALVIPLLLHPVWEVAVVFAVASFVLAFTLAVTFQLAHCLEEAEFSSIEEMAAAGRVGVGPPPDRDDGRLRAAQPGAGLVPRRPQLPGGAPPVLAGLPRPLPGDGGRRAGGLRPPRRAPPVAPGAVAGARVARPLAAPHGRRRWRSRAGCAPAT